MNNKPVAGEYRAIGLDLQGMSAEQATELQKKVEETKSRVDASDLTGMTKHDLVGDIVFSTIFGYFGLNDIQDQISAQSSDMVQYRAPSFGLFMTSVTPLYWFGIPREVKMGGLVMDVDNYMTMARCVIG